VSSGGVFFLEIAETQVPQRLLGISMIRSVKAVGRAPILAALLINRKMFFSVESFQGPFSLRLAFVLCADWDESPRWQRAAETCPGPAPDDQKRPLFSSVRVYGAILPGIFNQTKQLFDEKPESGSHGEATKIFEN